MSTPPLPRLPVETFITSRGNSAIAASLATFFVLGYHGCDKAVAESLLRGNPFKASTNAYDWLGHGIYFWEANPRRGLEFANDLKKSPRGPSKIKRASVVGAVVDLGNCLDLTTSAGVEQIRIAYKRLKEISAAAKLPLPQNHGDGLRRNLDCAVIELLHEIRREARQPEIDTVKGVFIEGSRAYPESGFYEKTHTQICVRNPNAIKGVFRVARTDLGGL